METLTKTKWVIDPTHSDVAFKVKHMMISTVSGKFENFEANIETENDDFKEAEINVAVNIDSITTNNTDRDNHLKSDDFFNAEKFPTMKFKSNAFDGSTLKGDLTIRDITKSVVLDVDYNGTAVDPYGQTKAGFEITGEINRKDFNLSWSAITEAGNIVVSDKIKLTIDAQFIKQA
ncbi:YceI family protein [Crocinitomix catalasitica]|uniref:YceI family protein n=1 Tax=Crocinitomix catalasitica TaxID=184607 RepID=UPI000482C80C|nr:YceI family protein [Crocinitomix catalasitica]